MPRSYRRRPTPIDMPVQSDLLKKKMRREAKQFDLSLRILQDICPDSDSQHRLGLLQKHFEKREHGVSESAQAEIDIAIFLVKAGLSLSFVKEMEHRTADLECYLHHDRLFVEVTVIVPNHPDRSRVFLSGSSFADKEGEDSPDFFKDGLVKRILARINEKATQLSDYCAPVLMALTVVHQDQSLQANGKNLGRRLSLDLQQLGGVITTALAGVPQLSAVLLTLWNIQPAESKANIRMSNVHLGEWVPGSKASSQVRLLALNPAANYFLEPDVQMALRRVL